MVNFKKSTINQMIEERKPMADDLTSKLESVLDELRSVMEDRAERIKSLRAEIQDIENENTKLEDQITQLLGSFNE